MRRFMFVPLFAVSAVLLFAAGCQPTGGGILLTPVPASHKLEETVVCRDSGLLVPNKIVIIDVEGMLINMEMGPMLGPKENPVSLFAEKLDKAACDSSIKAVLLRINSPGGTVSASEIMYHKLMEFQACRPDVKLAAIILDMGASGGYYLACAAPRIYALPSSITGSIGVIFETFSLQGLMDKIGISTTPIKSGANKDMASPFRNRNAEEMKILQGIIDSYYETFLAVVLKGRSGKVTREALTTGTAPLADGRVFTGEQACKFGLVDELLYPEQALARLKCDAGVERVKVVVYNRPLGYKGSIYAGSGTPPATASNPTINMFNIDASSLLFPQGPRFLYLWTGPR